MKKILLSLALVAAILLTAPYFISQIVESERKALFKHVEKTSSQFTVKNSQYEHSWFGATAKNTLVIPLVDAAVPTIELTIVEDISFGPLLFSSSGIALGYARSIATIEVNDQRVESEVVQLIKDNISIQVLYTLSQDFIANIQVKKIETHVHNEKIIIEPLVANYALVDDKYTSANVHWLGATLADSKATFLLGEMKLDSEQTLIGDSVYSSNALFKGKFTMQLSAMNVLDKLGSPLFSMADLSMKAESKLVDDLMAVSLGYHVDEIIKGEQRYNKANFSMSLNNLKVDVLQQVLVLFNNAQQDALQLTSPEYSDQFLALSDKLLAHEPAFKMSDFSVETPSGKIESDLSLSIDKVIFDPNNTATIITALRLDAKGNAPTPFLEKLGLIPFVDMYVQQGYLLKNEKDTNFTLNLAEGMLEVNGNPIPL